MSRLMIDKYPDVRTCSCLAIIEILNNSPDFRSGIEHRRYKTGYNWRKNCKSHWHRRVCTYLGLTPHLKTITNAMMLQCTSTRKLDWCSQAVPCTRCSICYPHACMPQCICGLVWLLAWHGTTSSWFEVSETTHVTHFLHYTKLELTLSALGRSLIGEMNRLGVLVDLSHTSDATAKQAIAHSKAPVIWSHSSARAVHDVPRNVPDDVLGLIGLEEGKKDAVVMVSHTFQLLRDLNARR